MNIYTIISKEATEKYADTYLAYNYYEKTVERIKEKARTGYKVYVSISMVQQLKQGYV